MNPLEETMKGIRMTALAAMLVMGAGTVAAAQAAPQPETRAEKQDKRARAQGERGRKAGAQGMLRGALRGIELSDAQKSQVAVIAEKHRTEMEALRTSMRASHESGTRPDSATRAAFRARMQQLAQSRHAELRALLTVEQQKTFDANMAKMKERGEKGEKGMKHRRGERQGRK
jgi:hypothetical protein